MVCPMNMKDIEAEDANAPLLPPDYVPSDSEEFMNPLMLQYFRQKLLTWRKELLQESAQTIQDLQETSQAVPDVGDQASADIQRTFELRTRERFYKLIGKIDHALERISNGTYGKCLVTDDNISIARLIARPIATMTLEAQEAHERQEQFNKKKI